MVNASAAARGCAAVLLIASEVESDSVAVRLIEDVARTALALSTVDSASVAVRE